MLETNVIKKPAVAINTSGFDDIERMAFNASFNLFFIV